MQESAIVNYHIKSQAPQAFHFDVNGLHGNIVSPELVPTQVSVQDVRPTPDVIAFKNNGITFEKHISNITRFDATSAWQPLYNEELKNLLKKTISAVEVIVFDHTLRIDDPTAPRQPARNVHTDYSVAGAKQRLIDILGLERAKEFQQGHYGFVNVWRPVENEIHTSPLGFIHPNSMQHEDWVDIDLKYPDRTGQILGVTANHKHHWLYLSHMTPDDVAIFNIYNNTGLPMIAHSALDMTNKSHHTMIRKSIESRILVRYTS